jgi:enterochelin esterase-like enzyme
MASAPSAPDIAIPRAVLRALARGGDALSSPWTAVAVGVLAVGLLAALVVARRRRRTAWPWGAGSLLATLLAVALAANAVSGYVPNVQSLQTALSGWGLAPAPFTHHGHAAAVASGAGHGAVSEYPQQAPAALAMPAHRMTWVYTPPGYSPTASARYPVVYLVHGSPGASGDWFAAGDAGHAMDVLLEHRLITPMIVVSVDVNGIGPSARDTECLNSTRGGSQVESYLYQVLVPWVDAHFQTVPDAAHRAIGGFSSGGFCALDQGLRHPGTFGTILSMDAYPSPGYGGRAMLATHQDWLRHDVSAYARTIRLDPAQRLFLALPAESHKPAPRAVRTIAAQLSARGQQVTLAEVRGLGHTWTMARVELPYALIFYSTALGSATGAAGAGGLAAAATR